jgi:hypothetical protein
MAISPSNCGRVREGLLHQAELEGERRSSPACAIRRALRIVGRIDDDHHVAEVLARGAEQRRPPMSICSTSSSNGVSGFCAALAKDTG